LLFQNSTFSFWAGITQDNQALKQIIYVYRKLQLNQRDKSMIEFLYKYMPIRIKFFEEPMLRATPLNELNDPFEGQFNKEQIENVLQQYKKVDKNEDVYNNEEITDISHTTEMEFEQLGIIAFTEDHINPLMWAHYANEHKGMVVQFKMDLLFSDSKYIDSFGDVSEFPERVVYRRELPSFKTEDEAVSKQTPYLWKKFNRSILVTKANDWLYEKESRSIFYLTDADRIICNDDKDIRKICARDKKIDLVVLEDGRIQITYPKGYEMDEDVGDNSIKFEISLLSENSIHLFRVNPKCIKGVYFGCKSSSLERSKCIEIIQKNSDLNHLSVYKMEVNKEAYSLQECAFCDLSDSF
jgi:hypothetical protein